MSKIDRRGFLKQGGMVAGLGTVGVSNVGTARAGKLGVRGQIRKPSGGPARGDQAGIVGRQFRVDYRETNKGGVFSKTLDQPDEVFIGYYQTVEDWTRLPAPERDGAPDLYALANRIDVTHKPVNLGSRQLPDAYLLQVLVVDESGTPVPNARFRTVHTRDGIGWGSGTHTTNPDGQLQYEDAPNAGTELVGNVTIEIQPPKNDNRFVETTYRREIEVTNPRTETFVLNEL
ncbi:twin-arginine translocation signal domain-containing protein [Halorubellus salinus]|uniref:twin-arginine translocation signal domain-containing protein n=1 Tax=Halorubellus salinus TaxID=755309 RepID=UPI001D098958|nr:twin-arginine translocation signal domain-containing protein [Halorubellus salinus]